MIIPALFLLCLLIFLFFKIPNFRWLLFSLLCFSFSLGVYDKAGIEVPSLVPALEMVRSNGRIISVFLLVLLLILLLTSSFLNDRRKDRKFVKLFPLPVKYLIFIRLLISFKIFIQTSEPEELIKFLLFMILIAVIYLLLINSNNTSEAVFNCLLSINFSCIVFLLFNSYQFFINKQALFYAGNLFVGSTPNPNHAAFLLSLSLPSTFFILHKIFSLQAHNYIKNLCVLLEIGTLLGTLYFLILTGSRTAVIMAAVVTILFLLFFKGNLAISDRITFILCSLVTSFLVCFSFLPEDLSTLFDGNSMQKLSLKNSFDQYSNRAAGNRIDVSLRLFNDFQDNFLFGIDYSKQSTGGENSYLTIAASLGIVGVILILFFTVSLIEVIFKIHLISNFIKKISASMDFVLINSSLMIILFGSLPEGFLLGTLTFSISVSLCYIYCAYILKDNCNEYIFQVSRIEDLNLYL